MATTPVFSNASDVAKAGEKIYREQLREKYEASHLGQFIVIEVVTGQSVLAKEPEDAIRQAHAAAPHGVFHMIKIGSPSPYQGGFSLSGRGSGPHDTGRIPGR
jgi:hypothetical protein